jgi:hypothetical protein
MKEFLEIVKLGFTSPNNQVRAENEKKLIDYRQSNPTNFLGDCMNCFSDSNVEAPFKQAIATIVRVSISSEIVLLPLI